MSSVHSPSLGVATQMTFVEASLKWAGTLHVSFWTLDHGNFDGNQRSIDELLKSSDP